MLQSKAGYIDARPLTANSAKSSCNARLDHTCGSIASFRPWFGHFRSTPRNGHSQTAPACRKSAKTGSDKPYSITSSVRARRDYRSAKSHRRRAQAYRPPIRYGSRVFPAALVIDLDQQSDFSRREYAGYLCNFMGEKNVGSCSIRSQAEPRN
jgi:hypothetical protein